MSAGPLHILNGDSTRITLEQSTVPGTYAVWADVLYEGPVPPLAVGAAEWRRVRASFHGAGDAAREAEALRMGEGWEAALDRFAEYPEAVLWLEHDLFDQLLLARHLAWFAARDLGRTALSLICIGSFPGRPTFRGLGELTAAELTSLFPSRAPVTRAQLALGRRAFDAFTGPDPRALERVANDGEMTLLPFLAPALRRFLEEYPSTRNGLSRSEHQLLTLLGNAGGAQRLGEAWRAMHARESAYYITDLGMRELVTRLCAEPALVSLLPAASGREWDASVRITPAGREVLAGGADRVHQLGRIDRWMGGVHLVGAESPWRWDAERRHLVPRAG